MALVEESDDLVASLEAVYMLADSDDLARAVGAGDDAGAEGEGVLALGDNEIAVLQQLGRGFFFPPEGSGDAHVERGSTDC